MSELLPVNRLGDVLSAYRNTPVADLLAYLTLRRPHGSHDRAELLIGMCMENRVALRIPDNFAYILRAGGANLQRIEFKVSYALAVGDVPTICLISHECGMVELRGRRDGFVSGLVENGGWKRREAEEHLDQFSAVFEIPDPAAFLISEAGRLREGYPRVMVAPLLYQIREGLLYQIAEGEQTLSSAMRSWADVLRYRGTRLCHYASACLQLQPVQ